MEPTLEFDDDTHPHIQPEFPDLRDYRMKEFFPIIQFNAVCPKCGETLYLNTATGQIYCPMCDFKSAAG